MRPGSKWSALLKKIPATEYSKETYICAAGDNAIFVEYGYDTDSIDYMDMFRAQAVYQRAMDWKFTGYTCMEHVVSFIPQWRTIQYQFDPLHMTMDEMVNVAIDLEEAVGDNRNIMNSEFNSPIIELPVCYQHSMIQETLRRYVENVNPNSIDVDRETWSSMPFIARCNGLTVEEAHQKIFGTDYLAYTSCFNIGQVMGIALDRRCMLLVSKQNPPRTYTVKSALGLGGFDWGPTPLGGPGGFPLYGLSAYMVQVEQIHPDFKRDVGIYHTFDRIRMVEVSEEEIDWINHCIDTGSDEFRFKITPSRFSVAEWMKFEEEHRQEIDAHLTHIRASLEEMGSV